MSGLTVRKLDNTEYDQWDSLVRLSPDGTLFHTTDWLKASDRKFSIYGCFKGKELWSGIPISFETNHSYKSATKPLLTPYLGVVHRSNTTKYVNKLNIEKEINRAIASMLKSECDAVWITFSPTITDIQPFIWEGFTPHLRYTYILPLINLNEVWQSMDHDRRNNILKAQKEGYTIVQQESFETMFQLIEKSFARQGEKEVFKESALKYLTLLRQKNQCRTFFTQDSSGKPVAVVHIVWDTKRSYYLLGGTEPKHHGVVALAVWEAIKYTYNQLGLRQFDFEGSMNPSIERFFRAFGGIITPYYGISWMRPKIKMLSQLSNYKYVVFSSIKKFLLLKYLHSRKQTIGSLKKSAVKKYISS